MGSDVRPAAVAGTWYPAAADRLGRELDEYVAGAAIDTLPAPIAIVAPHAGLKYSGPVAAFAYKAVSGQPYRAAILVGPSHYVGFNGVSIWARGAWQTPYGPIPVAEELAGRIAAASAEIGEHRQAHGREHSLEMQLPFVAHLLPGVPIVPMVMGYQSRDTAFGLGDALARTLRAESEPRPLLIASSDLSHYQDARTAAMMDAVVLDHVERLDADGLMQALEREPHHACGGGPIVAVLRAARQLGATDARVLKYADSGDVSGDKSSVVGYMAAAVW
ncbi:MAG TPA: AmmeMemoRadiSam system protein B [Vicinamibacterales bacterium]|nr:AmmeMemoRadiSam system protein B [Vicinamibacterales bacterium]